LEIVKANQRKEQNRGNLNKERRQ